jgi:hypothetical protein
MGTGCTRGNSKSFGTLGHLRIASFWNPIQPFRPAGALACQVITCTLTKALFRPNVPPARKLTHATQASTTQRYAHLDADPLRLASNAIGGRIAAALEARKGKVAPLSRRR